MRELFQKALSFIREHPSIIYSLILVILIPAALFFNTYTITSGFEKNVDRITQTYAVLTEDILRRLVISFSGDHDATQRLIESLARENPKIVELSILERNPETDLFRAIASTDRESVGKEVHEIQNLLAWNEAEGIAFLAHDERGDRYWKVTKAFRNDAGEKLGLTSLSLSIADSDSVIQSVINRAYLILLGTILVVVLFVSNQTRLFGYAVALSKLREVDKMKDTFISMASHDLRSPLTAIRGYIELLSDKQKDSGDDETKKYIENITLSVNRLQNLVNDILEVSRLEGNRIPLTLTDLDPRSLIEQSVEELRSQAVLKHLELRIEPGDAAMVRADAERLKQVLVNLVGNAIKYTEKGSVTVSTKKKDREYLITVADTGFGISAEDQQRLFQKFSRIQTDKTKQIIGTGLGLWITLELVRRMGGTITVESIEGVGSHFTVHLPLGETA